MQNDLNIRISCKIVTFNACDGFNMDAYSFIETLVAKTHCLTVYEVERLSTVIHVENGHSVLIMINSLISRKWNTNIYAV